ncbi:MAG: LysM peptidoglycan-binding domain-containing protein [Candidatus Dormibacteria bacterium]
MDANAVYRRGRYYAPPVPRRKRARIKTGRILLVFGVLWVVLIHAVYGGGRTGSERITVQPGETLFSIAQDRYPEDDPRSRVADIVKLNHLGDQVLHPGETLLVPAR